ncbi:hypothetical protein [Nonomuraea rosea]|uniref:hypothetical protein n=1 Tax=Nonomuraea rosea TaxID=638574 RepID=UPI0031ECAA91
MSITWGEPLESSWFSLALRGDRLGEMDRFVGRVVAGVELLEWTADGARISATWLCTSTSAVNTSHPPIGPPPCPPDTPQVDRDHRAAHIFSIKRPYLYGCPGNE